MPTLSLPGSSRRVAFRVAISLVCLLPAAALQAPAQQQPAPQQPAQQQNDQILTELKSIRQLLEKLVVNSERQVPAPPAAPVLTKVTLPAIPSPYTVGSPTAPVTVVEFTDLQCPFCRRFRLATYPDLKKEFIDSGKVRFVSFDFPLSAIHPFAEGAARASRCAVEQGKGLEMREAILVNNEHLGPELYSTLAKDLGMDPAALQTCIADQSRFGDEAKANLAYGTAAGVGGTPTFVVAPTSATKVEGDAIVGAEALETFRTAILRLLPKP